MADFEVGEGDRVIPTTRHPIRFSETPVQYAGAPPLHLGELSLWGPGAGSFSIANDDCSARTVSPGENCRLSVRFSLSRRGPRAAYLQVPTLRGGSFWVQLSADVPAQMTDISTSSSVIRWCAGHPCPG